MRLSVLNVSGWGEPSPEALVQLSCGSMQHGEGSAIQGPVKGGTGSAQHGFGDPCPPLTQTRNIITDSIYSGAMALGNSSDLEITMALVAAQRIRSAWSSDTNMFSGKLHDPGHAKNPSGNRSHQLRPWLL